MPKTLNITVVNNSNHNCPKLEITQISLKEYMDKQTSTSMQWNKKEHTIHTTSHMNQRHYAESKKPVSNDYMLCDSTYMSF